MSLVPAICTQCGASIEVDNTLEAAICKHCGTAFIVEKAIHQYTTNITNHNNFAGANVQIHMNVELEQLIAAAEGFERLGEVWDANKKYNEITQKYPQDVRGWLGRLRTEHGGCFVKAEPAYDDGARTCKWYWYTETVDFAETVYANVYKNAYLLADDATKKMLEEAKEKYVRVITADIEKARQRVSLESLQALVGDKIYEIFTRDYPRLYLYNRDGKLYFLYVGVRQHESGDRLLDIKSYEIESMDENGALYAKHRLNFYPNIKIQLLYIRDGKSIAIKNGDNGSYVFSVYDTYRAIIDSKLETEQMIVDNQRKKLQKANKRGFFGRKKK